MGAQRERICIVVKTYPRVSQKYGELVCCGGITEDAQWRRLYPVPFRRLPEYQRFRKYQWIAGEMRLRPEDKRPETRQPSPGTVDVEAGFLPPGDWLERMELVYAAGVASIEDLSDRRDTGECSMGTVRVGEMLDMVYKPIDPDEERRWKAKLSQQQLPGVEDQIFRTMRPLPFRFIYEFRCDDARCADAHRIGTGDWEVGALFWRLVGEGKSDKEAAEGVRQKFLAEIARADRSLHFYVGTIQPYGNWTIGGVASPPRQTVEALLSPRLAL